MWTQSHSKIYPNLKKEAIWRLWADVNHWSEWDKEIDYCKMEGEFVEGSQFTLKPKGGPKTKITLCKVIRNRQFTDYCKFLGAIMIDDHQLEETKQGLKIKSTITMKGPLSFIWAKVVAKKVADSVPAQMDALVELARSKM